MKLLRFACLLLLFVPCIARADHLGELFSLTGDQIVERMLDNGAIILSSSGRPLRLERSHIGRRLICRSDDKSTMFVPEITGKMFHGEPSVLVRCQNGTVEVGTATN